MLWNGNVDKTNVMRISREPPPLQITIQQKQLKNVKVFNYLGSIIINDARSTREIKSKIAVAKAAFNRKTFHRQIGRKHKEDT